MGLLGVGRPSSPVPVQISPLGLGSFRCGGARPGGVVPRECPWFPGCWGPPGWSTSNTAPQSRAA